LPCGRFFNTLIADAVFDRKEYHGDEKQRMTRLCTYFIAAGLFCLFMNPRGAHAACTLIDMPGAQLNYGRWATPGSTQTADITTAGVNSGTGSGTFLYGTTAAGAFTLTNTGSCAGTLTIALSNLAAGAETYTSFHMNYDGVEKVCPATGTCTVAGLARGGTGAGKVLLVGATLTNTSSAGGTASPTFNVKLTGPATLNTTGTGTIKFDTPLSFSAVTDIDFGAVKAGAADDYTIDTLANVSHTGSGAIEAGTPVAGSVTIAGSSTQPVTISASPLAADQGVSITAESGKYGAASETSFPIAGGAPGAGTVLKLGVTVHADGTQTDSTTARPTFVVTVVYQ
jgi:hypothetical protein